ncbi:hypothetical protein AAF712_000642 [Marasmius tenuissimus]|uniref:DUF7918 domain-containing protein n=1 Tax=Marasmius tenuissimus TaxID=585030 RepID=A0ABR3ADV5_9AGAR
MVLSCNEFTAWVTIEGDPVEEYKVHWSTPQKQTMCCWIPSQAGRNYQVHWRDSRRTTATDGLVVIDGKHCGTKTISPDLEKPDTTSKKGFRTSSDRVAPFQFAKLQTTDNESQAGLSSSSLVGNIELLIFRVRIKEPEVYIQQARHQDQVFYEKDVKGLQHHTTSVAIPVLELNYAHSELSFGKAEAARERPAIGVTLLSEVPVAKFRFYYRPIDALRAERIAPSVGTSATDPIVLEDDSEEEDTKQLPIAARSVEKSEEIKRDVDISVSEVILISDDEEDVKSDPLKKITKTKTTPPRVSSPIMIPDDEPETSQEKKPKLPKPEPSSTQSMTSRVHFAKPRTVPSVIQERSPTTRPQSNSSRCGTKTSRPLPQNVKQERHPSARPDAKRTLAPSMIRPVGTPKSTGRMRPPPVPIRVSTTDVPKPEVGTPRLPPQAPQAPMSHEDALAYPKEEAFTPRPLAMDEDLPSQTRAKVESSGPIPSPKTRIKTTSKLESQPASLQPIYAVKSEEISAKSPKRKVEEDVSDDEIDEEDVQNTLATSARLTSLLALASDVPPKRMKRDHPNSCQ